MGKKFGQVECAAYLQRCESQDQVEDVLTAYVYTKFAKGSSTHQVLHKLYLLVCYLKASRQIDALERFPRGLLVVQYHVQFLGGGAIGARPTTNPLANEVWNHVRRNCFKPTAPRRRSAANATSRAAAEGRDEDETESEWGALGPGAVIAMKSAERSGERNWHARGEQAQRVTALLPDEVAMLGPHRQAPSYHTLTLPPYDEHDEGDIST